MNPFSGNPYYDPKMPSSFWRGDLPHYEQEGKLHYVTFRLRDSMPEPVVAHFKSIKDYFLRTHPYPWDEQIIRQYNELVSNPIERYLDAGYGDCVLANPQARQILQESIDFYDGIKYSIVANVIMPNHVHMIVIPAGGCELVTNIESVMRYSATRINRLLGRKGRMWQTEPWDTIIRSYKQYCHCLDYIRHNPDHLPLGMYSFGGMAFRQ